MLWHTMPGDPCRLAVAGSVCDPDCAEPASASWNCEALITNVFLQTLQISVVDKWPLAVEDERSANLERLRAHDRRTNPLHRGARWRRKSSAYNMFLIVYPHAWSHCLCTISECRTPGQHLDQRKLPMRNVWAARSLRSSSDKSSRSSARQLRWANPRGEVAWRMRSCGLKHCVQHCNCMQRYSDAKPG